MRRLEGDRPVRGVRVLVFRGEGLVETSGLTLSGHFRRWSPRPEEADEGAIGRGDLGQ